MADDTEKLTDMTNKRVSFRARLATKDVKIGDVTFRIQALPGVVLSWLSMEKRDSLINAIRFGLVDVIGLCDELGLAHRPEFEQVEILGRSYKAITLDWIDHLSSAGGAFGDLFAEIIDLSTLSIEDKKSLDFISRGEQTAPAVDSAAVAETWSICETAPQLS